MGEWGGGWFVIDSLIMRRLVMREPQIHQLFMSAEEGTARWSITEVAPASRRGAKDESRAAGRKVTGARRVRRPKENRQTPPRPRSVRRPANDPS